MNPRDLADVGHGPDGEDDLHDDAPSAPLPRRAKLVIGESYIELPPARTAAERESAIERAARFGYRPIPVNGEVLEEMGAERVYLEPTELRSEASTITVGVDRLDRLEALVRRILAELAA